MSSEYEIDPDILDLCYDNHIRFVQKNAQENLTDSSTSQLIEEGDPQNLSYGSMSPFPLITQFKGCVRYIFASLFLETEREHL